MADRHGWHKRSLTADRSKFIFASELRLECLHFQINYHVRAKLQVIEEKVDVEFLVANRKPILASHKSESDA